MLKALQMCNPTHIPKVLPGQLNTPTAAHTCPRGQTQQHATNRRRCAEHSSLVEPPLRMRAPTAQRTTSDAQCGRCWEAGAALLGLAAPRVCDKQRAVILDQHLLDLLLRLLVHVCARDTPHVSPVHSGASAERRRPAGSAAALRSPPRRLRPGDAPSVLQVHRLPDALRMSHPITDGTTRSVSTSASSMATALLYAYYEAQINTRLGGGAHFW